MSDYGALLRMGEQNAAKGAQQLAKSRLGQKFQRGPNAAGIAAFKAKQAHLESARLRKAQQEKEKLMALRAQNSKSLRKSKVMASRTKDNDFSKIQLTSDQLETKGIIDSKVIKQGVADKRERLKMKLQMDETIDGLTKRDRVKVLQKIERDKPVQVRNESKPKMSDYVKKAVQSKKVDAYSAASSAAGAKRPRAPPPPALSYAELLKQAEAKSNQKVSLEELIEKHVENKRKTYEQITTREKLEERDSYTRRRETSNAKAATTTSKTETRSMAPPPAKSTMSKGSSKYSTSAPATSKPSQPASASSRSQQSSSSRSYSSASAPSRPPPAKPVPQPRSLMIRDISPTAVTRLPKVARPPSPPPPPPRPKSNGARPTSAATERYVPSQANGRSSQNMPSSSRAQYIPSSMGRGGRNPEPYVPRQVPPPPPARSKPKLPPIGKTYYRGKYDDYEPEPEDDYEDEYEEDEYDELDDFIDDGPLDNEQEAVSAAIRDIFGYDKRKWRWQDEEDDDIEEASYSQVMREEKYSLKEGIREDLEDIAREEDEKKRRNQKLKLLAKQKRMKSRF